MQIQIEAKKFYSLLKFLLEIKNILIKLILKYFSINPPISKENIAKLIYEKIGDLYTKYQSFFNKNNYLCSNYKLKELETWELPEKAFKDPDGVPVYKYYLRKN